METFSRWTIGLVVSLLIGHFVTGEFVDLVRSHYRIDEKWIDENFDYGLPNLPRWVIGPLERLFFTLLVAFNVSGVATGMMIWLLVKMVSNWNLLIPPLVGENRNLKTDEEKKREKEQDMHRAMLRRYTWSGFLGTLMSLLFALLGGLICGGLIWR